MVLEFITVSEYHAYLVEAGREEEAAELYDPVAERGYN